MAELLGLIIISFTITSFLLVPFIDFLFYARNKFKKGNGINASSTDTPITNKLLVNKDVHTPVGGGLLIIPVVILLTFLIVLFTDYRMTREVYILFFTLAAFGLVGFFDDIRKIFAVFKGKYAGIKGRYLLIFQLICASLVASFLYYWVGISNIYVPLFGNIILGIWYIPLAIFVIIAFANAYNISDGLDGLSTGLLAICLFAFLALAHAVFNETLSVFVGIWIGALIAFLYFNIFPARIYLGDAGAFAFGAALAVVGLLSGKIIGLAVIGGVYIIIVSSSLLQLLSKRILKRKLFPIAPIHLYFRYIGWEEPKVVIRFWLAGAIFAIFGLWLSLLSS